MYVYDQVFNNINLVTNNKGKNQDQKANNLLCIKLITLVHQKHRKNFYCNQGTRKRGDDEMGDGMVE